MKNHWRNILSFLPKKIERKYYEDFFAREHSQWVQNGKPFPASNVSKQQTLKELQKKYKVKILVETGTYLGDTLYSLYDDFDQLYSIELSDYFYTKAKKRFVSYPKIKLLSGDSSTLLLNVVTSLAEPALFWLDGHYSGGLTARGDTECPVYKELEAIFSSQAKHVIVIDDARLFVGENDYPTLDELKAFVSAHRGAYDFTVSNDSIKLLPAILVRTITFSILFIGIISWLKITPDTGQLFHLAHDRVKSRRRKS